jgi:hypothetical protein
MSEKPKKKKTKKYEDDDLEAGEDDAKVCRRMRGRWSEVLFCIEIQIQ